MYYRTCGTLIENSDDGSHWIMCRYPPMIAIECLNICQATMAYTVAWPISHKDVVPLDGHTAIWRAQVRYHQEKEAARRLKWFLGVIAIYLVVRALVTATVKE